MFIGYAGIVQNKDEFFELTIMFGNQIDDDVDLRLLANEFPYFFGRMNKISAFEVEKQINKVKVV